MKKSLLISACLALMAASCTNEQYLGDEMAASGVKSVGFSTSTARTMRAAGNASAANDALEHYVSDFAVSAIKWNDEGKPIDVIENYCVSYATDRTASNTNDWEYVQNITLAGGGTRKQTIKYWDYAAKRYQFWAIAPASQLAPQFAKGTDGAISTATFTLDLDKVQAGEADEPFIAAPKQVTPYNYGQPVTLNFTHFLPQVRVGLYETVRGYSVSDVRFYQNDGTVATATTERHQYPMNLMGTFHTAATYQLTFDNAAGTYTSAIQATPAPTTVSDKAFATIAPDGVPIKEQASAPSLTYFQSVLPVVEPKPITLKMDYTLTSNDPAVPASGDQPATYDVIHVTGATATVPADFTRWESNKQYTYLFKISNQTNGTTGGADDPKGLYPIVFDAVVEQNTDAGQGSITTLSNPSISTYQAGSVEGDELNYYTGKALHIFVMKGNDRVTFTADATLQVTSPTNVQTIYTAGTVVIIDADDLEAGVYTLTYKDADAEVQKQLTVKPAVVTPAP